VGDRERFRESGAAQAAAGRLAEAALCIAAEGDPSVDVDGELRALGEMAEGCPDELPGLRAYLFDQVGFRGNAANYYDPRNSYLHEVRRRRLGIPISLTVLAIDVGARAGVPLVGIGLPGHFLARSTEDPSAYLDAFSGRLLSPDGVGYLFRTISSGGEIDPAWLEPVDHPTTLRRMLANLRQIFARRLDETGVLWTLGLDVVLPEPSFDARVARATCLARVLRTGEAVAVFEELAADAEARGDGEVAQQLRHQIKVARSLLQ
jgi:hypothetical protein